jgi:hypothetical protein
VIIVCRTSPALSIDQEDLTPKFWVTVGGQTGNVTVQFFYYYFTAFAPVFGSSSGTWVTVTGGGFTTGVPVLSALSAGIGAAVFSGRIVNGSTLEIAVILSSQVAVGSSLDFALSATLNGADYTSVATYPFSAYTTAVTNATIESGPMSGNTTVELSGASLCFIEETSDLCVSDCRD